MIFDFQIFGFSDFGTKKTLILEFKRKEAKFSQSSQRLMKQIKEASLGRFNLCLIFGTRMKPIERIYADFLICETQ
jgi:hypothetical protein